MTHTKHGSIAGEAATGGIVAMDGAVHLGEWATVAFEGVRLTEVGVERDDPAIALGLAGRVNKTIDTVEAVWLLSVVDAGALAGALADAAARSGGADALGVFMAGLEQGLRQR